MALGCVVQARHQVEMESTYLGDGWFQYRLRSVYDPYFLFFDLAFLGINRFPGFQEIEPPVSDWQAVAVTGTIGTSVGWNYTNCSYVACQTVPYERTFRARSQFRAFKTERMGGAFGMSLALRGGYHGTMASVNIVGYANVDVLVPCDDADADGSPTNLVVRQSLGLPDPQIAELIRSGNDITGISFSYTEASTMLLQGSTDLQTWRNVAFIYGNPPLTTWTAGTPLNRYGNYFRLLLAAEGHTAFTNQFDLSTAMSVNRTSPPRELTTAADARVVSCRPVRNGVAVQVATSAGRPYVVKLVNRRGESLQQRAIDGSARISTVVFDITSTDPLFATVAPLP